MVFTMKADVLKHLAEKGLQFKHLYLILKYKQSPSTQETARFNIKCMFMHSFHKTESHLYRILSGCSTASSSLRNTTTIKLKAGRYIPLHISK